MSNYIMVIDTETIGVNKKFCYDVGYVIAEIDSLFGRAEIIEKKNFLVKQVWRNTMLFSTAYYAEKKPIYTKMLRNKTNDICVMRYDEIMAEIQKAIDYHNVEIVYAYNSKFDEEVFNFNCDWFKVENPFSEIPFYDIRAYFMDRVIRPEYMFKTFCEEYELFTESGNYSTTAETAYKFITGETDFIESHTALDDSEIELKILTWCACWGAEIYQPLEALKSIERKIEKDFTIKYKGEKIIFSGYSATWYKKNRTLLIK